ncbi:PEPxxWA-CTERM sorting domain-containing protein [Sphingosinicellaceae bacterium]|nr:PEPxxWA-CTERM sorting domain-containing protein [Sphingosinicellaceae bacterium]
MATVKYNDYYPDTSAFYDNVNWYTNTSCHELGHVLGLTHADTTKANANSGSCTDMTNDPTGTKSGYGPLSDLAPGLIDFIALDDIYAVPSGVQLPSTIENGESLGSFVPEPAAWTLMLTGFGIIGSTMRRGSRRVTTVAA